MTFLTSIYNFLVEVGRIRAASYLARTGQHEAAQKLMTSDLKG